MPLSTLPARPGRRRAPVLIAAALVLLVGGGLAARSMSGAQRSKADKPAVIMELAASDLVTAQQRSIEQPVPLSGTLSPVRQAILNAKVEGVVTQVDVRPGERVKAGQVLARLDTRDLRAQLDARLASLERARAELALAARNRARSADLLQQNFISPTSHDATENQYRVAAAQVKIEEAQAEMARKAMQDATIRAPFSGVIATRHIDVGERVGVNQKLFSLVDLSELEFEAWVGMRDLPRVRTGQTVSLKVEGFGERTFNGRVERIAPVAETGSRMVPVYVRIGNADQVLKGGLFAQGTVAVARVESATVLPLSALRGLDGAHPFVLAVEKDRLVERKVRLSLVNDLDKTAAVEGITTGQMVVIAKLDNLKAGQQVKLPNFGTVPSGKPA
jgi:RND family efflux transporter MFP subunit